MSIVVTERWQRREADRSMAAGGGIHRRSAAGKRQESAPPSLARLHV